MTVSITSTQSLQPSSVQDYVMLLKPRVMSLVIFTGIVGMLLAPGTIHPVIAFSAIFALAMGAGGSGALNMWYEYRLDSLMGHTAKRPIPQGRISPSDALAFGMILSMGSVIMMGLVVNVLAALFLAFTIVFYVCMYTMWLKPTTSQNIVIGGVAGALPPPYRMGFSFSIFCLGAHFLFLDNLFLDGSSFLGSFPSSGGRLS